MATEDHRAFPGDSAMAAAFRGFDWRSTPLGAAGTWPPALRTAVDMMLSSRFPQCIVWGPQLITLYNDAFAPILGAKPYALGRSFKTIWAEAWETIGPLVARAYEGQATFIEDFPLVVNRHGSDEQAYFTFCYSPIRDEKGDVSGMLDTVIETTTKVQAERETHLLNAELAHRIRNTLTIVAAIVSQTFRSGASAADMRRDLLARISALGHAHDILTRSTWSSAPIAAVVAGALGPHQGASSQVHVSGPPLDLSPKQSMGLALAIHELATNAVKYGALSVPQGEVLVQWRVDKTKPPQFHLEWVERGGPCVTPPSQAGFGTRLIEQVLGDEFGGEVQLSFDAQGVRCELTTPLANLRLGSWRPAS